MEIVREINSGDRIKDPKDVFNYLEEFRNEDREHVIVIGLDTRNKPCYREIVHIGSLNQILVSPREIFKKAIVMSCNSIIIAHNHPSGDTKPSDGDITIMKQLIQAGDFLGIKVLDNIIIGKDDYNSII